MPPQKGHPSGTATLSSDEIAAGVGRADSPAVAAESGNVALIPPGDAPEETAAPDATGGVLSGCAALTAGVLLCDDAALAGTASPADGTAVADEGAGADAP